MDFPIKDEFKAFLVRLWFAGLVSYFVLMGTNVSNDLIDLIFVLPIAHVLCEIILTNNIIRGMFKTRLQLVKKYKDLTTYERIKLLLYVLLENLLTVLIVILIYTLVNKILINVRNLDDLEVPFAVEPFGYSIIFITVYYVFYFIKNKYFLKFLQGGITANDL